MASTMSRRASYKDTLQPALQRRFSSTATILLAVSYLEALLFATWGSFFWSWFPFGSAGIRTALIFACGLSILVLRIANYHVGRKTTTSGLQTLGTVLLSFQTYETGFWYGLSSLLFCAIFLTSMPDSSSFHWITYFSGDRARLNERPLFLVFYLLSCALLQTIKHYRLDLDRLDLGLPKPETKNQAQHSAVFSSSFQTIFAKLPRVLSDCIKQAVCSLFLSFALYYFLLRSVAWSWTLALLRPFYSLPQTSMLPPTRPIDVFLLARCFYAGTLLLLVWSTANVAFSIFMVREPLKNERPLTSDSKDPNGSLLNGLKSKKLSVRVSVQVLRDGQSKCSKLTLAKTFAMWELSLIAKQFEARRKSIYSDIDRKDGSMWSQIYASCMELLRSIESRADDYGNLTALAVAEPATAASRQRVSAPLREAAILSKRAQTSGFVGGVEKTWDQIGRAPGFSPASELSPLAKKTWQEAKDRILSKENQEAFSPNKIKNKLEKQTFSMMKLGWTGAFLRQDFRSRFAAAVLGRPYAEPALYIHAVEAICQLAVYSLAEDEFGNVHRDVASLVRTMTTVINKVETLRKRFPNHWTDGSGVRECPEVERLMDALRTGLGQVMATFEPYSSDLRLSRGDVRLAKEAATEPMKTLPATEEATTSSNGEDCAMKRKPAAARRAQEKTQQEVEMEQIR